MTSTSEPTATADLPQRATELQGLLDEQASAAEELGQLTEPVVEALHRAGLWTMWVPKVLGGAELDAVSSVQVIENLAYGDPSVGWVVMAAALSIGTAGAYLDDSAIEELFDPSEGKYPVIAGQGTRPGVAVPDDGGFRVTGNWSFASGLLHGNYIHTLAIVEGTGEPRIFVLPVEKAKLLGNWDVMGLRATGSIDYSIDDVYVPEAFSHFAVLDTAKRGGSLFNLGIIGLACNCHSGWALGTSRRLLDELESMVREKAGRPGAQADSDSFLEELARVEGHYRAAHALVYETWAGVAETLARGDKLSKREHTLIRLALANATWTGHEVSEFVYIRGGTSALRSGRVQKLFRDMHAGTQHVTSGPGVQREVARELAGLSGDKQWVFLELMDL